MASGHRHRYFETGLTSPPLRPFLIHSPTQSGSSVRVDRPLEASPKSKCQSIRLFSRPSLSLSPSFFFCLSKRPLSFPPSVPPSLPIFFAAALARPLFHLCSPQLLPPRRKGEEVFDRPTELPISGDSKDGFYKLGIPRRLADLRRFSSSASPPPCPIGRTRTGGRTSISLQIERRSRWQTRWQARRLLFAASSRWARFVRLSATMLLRTPLRLLRS